MKGGCRRKGFSFGVKWKGVKGKGVECQTCPCRLWKFLTRGKDMCFLSKRSKVIYIETNLKCRLM